MMTLLPILLAGWVARMPAAQFRDRPTVGIDVSSNGKRAMFWAGKRVSVFDWENDKTLRHQTLSVRVADACLAENGERLVLLREDGVLRIEETVSGELIRESELISEAQLKDDHPWSATERGKSSVSSSDDAERLLVDYGTGTAFFFDFEGAPKGEFQVPRVRHLSEAPVFAQRGRFALTFDKKSISVVSVDQTSKRQEFGCNGSFLGIAVDDERGLIATGHTGGGVVCWSLDETGALGETWRYVFPDALNAAAEPHADWDAYSYDLPRIISLAFQGESIFFSRSIMNDIGVLDVGTGELIAAHRARGGSPGRRLRFLSGSPKGSNWIYFQPIQSKVGTATLAEGELTVRELGDCRAAFASKEQGLVLLRGGKLERSAREGPPVVSRVATATAGPPAPAALPALAGWNELDPLIEPRHPPAPAFYVADHGDYWIAWRGRQLDVLDWKTRTIVRRQACPAPVIDACMAAKGTRIAIIDSVGVLRIHEAATGKLLKKIETSVDAEAGSEIRRDIATVSSSEEAQRLLVRWGTGTASVFDFEGTRQGDFRVGRTHARTHARTHPCSPGVETSS